MASNYPSANNPDSMSSDRDNIIFANQPQNTGTSDLYQSILQATKKDVRDSIIEFLTNCRWGETRKLTSITMEIGGKKQVIPTTKKTQGWVSNVPNAKMLMPLENAIELGDYVADQVDVVFSTTYYDPNINTLTISGLIATVAAQMLDNPRYEFKGNETDSASFALKVISKIHASMNRSIGGFMTKQIGTSTQNIYKHDVREGGDFVKTKDGGLEKFFNLGNNRK